MPAEVTYASGRHKFRTQVYDAKACVVEQGAVTASAEGTPAVLQMLLVPRDGAWPRGHDSRDFHLAARLLFDGGREIYCELDTGELDLVELADMFNIALGRRTR